MRLKYNTVSPLLMECLTKLMSHSVFDDFVLVGGTALSLCLGHRNSIDIDLFTAQEYGTLDKTGIKSALHDLFRYVDNAEVLDSNNIGYTVYIGNECGDSVKLDMFYTEPFIAPIERVDGIRIASLEDIAGMKMLAIVTGCRKKDFWDIHELLEHYSLGQLMQFGIARNPHVLDEESMLDAFDKMNDADDDAPVLCLKGKYWEFVKEDLKDAVKAYKGL
jgi:predicted nucleotidyltransferase component of viral defense system